MEIGKYLTAHFSFRISDETWNWLNNWNYNVFSANATALYTDRLIGNFYRKFDILEITFRVSIDK